MQNATDDVTATPALTARQRLFVAEYAVSRNATQAAIRAGYSASAARQIGSENLAKPAIAAEVARLEAAHLAQIEEAFAISRDKVLRQIAIGAFADVRALYDEHGNLIPPHRLTREQAPMIEGIEHIPQYMGHGAERVVAGYTIRYKLARRQPFLDMLMRHLGEYMNDNVQAGAATVNALANLVHEMRGNSTLPIVRRVED